MFDQKLYLVGNQFYAVASDNVQRDTSYHHPPKAYKLVQKLAATIQSTLKAWVLSGRSIVAHPSPYLPISPWSPVRVYFIID